MIKKCLVLIAVLLTTDIANAQKQDLTIDFIGYDGQSPVFVSLEIGNGRAIGHNGIYMYIGGRLINADIPFPKGTQCFKVRNHVYVFGYGDSLYCSKKLQFKQNGRELFFEQTVTWPAGLSPTGVVMNDEEFFTIAKRSRTHNLGSPIIIFRLKYRNPVNIDSIKIDGNGICLLDATNDHLYYYIEYPEHFKSIDYYGPGNGSIYQMSLKNGSIKEIVKDINTEDIYGTAIAPYLNIVYSSGVLEDYNKNNKVLSKDNIDSKRVFFSYEYNAFVDYKYTSDISKWECYHLAPGGKLPTEIRSVPCFKEAKGTK
jgi:hypothetical protein